MNTPARLVAFVVGSAAVLGGGYGLGSVVGPSAPDVAVEDDHGAADESMEAHASENADVMGGLAATQDGYTLVPTSTTLTAGRQQFAFQVMGPDGVALADYEVEHEKELHLIAVRRDGQGFQHVHPVRDDAGLWSTELDLQPGPWQIFADLVPDGADDVTLGTDIYVDGGAFQPRPTPAQSDVADVDDLRIELTGAAALGEETTLSFTLTRDGEAVVPEPYLGAQGHLVALREDDLAYLHVHPDADSLSFQATFPTPGRYLLYLDFSVDGQVRTAPFTVEVPA
jgi:hypothetical protein